ncbi:A disintegrin and metalloproteinase with thrombospondin motifs 14-like [Littorina saxatilis]|uniref:A disintegrin and metalloproteinase with thrombospondin motifs 14-like n=1 Tax=Littorina saxatilis TaxID=31220 RepID=UPI0038B661FA
MMISLLSLLCVGITTGCWAVDIDESEHFHVASLVERMKRNAPVDIHGHSLATLHAEDVDTGQLRRLTKRDVMSHVTNPSSSSRRFSLRMDTGDQVHMHLKRRNVVTSGTKVTERLPGGVVISHVIPLDCFFTGPTEDAVGHAALSLCDGEVMGTVQTNTHQYEMHLLPREVAAKKRRSADLVRVLVTWTELEKLRDFKQNHSVHKRAWDADAFGKADAYPVLPGNIEEIGQDNDVNYRGSRRQRSANNTIWMPPVRNASEDKHVIIEEAVYLDTFYQQALVDKFGFPNETHWFIKLALLKWSGIASVLSDPKLGWNITIRVVVLEVWKENPDWYNNESTATLGGRMGRICKGTKSLMVDHVTVLTKAIPRGKVGVSFVSAVCRKSFRCSAVMPTGLKFNTELHELGHSLGLGHEKDTACQADHSDHPGFMGGRFNYARACYKATFDRMFPNKKCLFMEHYNSSFDQHTELLTPGEQLGFDGQCQFRYGAEYVYLHFSSGESLCKTYRCVANDPSKVSNGTVRTDKAAPGTSCAPGRLCAEWGQRCLPVNETSYGQIFKVNANIQDGQWSHWSSFSDCQSGQLPGTASFRVATRTCDNPKPHCGAYCQGLLQKAQLCSQSLLPNSDGVNMTKLAEEICAFRHDHGPSQGNEHTNYSGEGVISAKRQDAVNACTVRCRMKDSKRVSHAAYVIPNGVTCAGLGSSFDDQLKGISRYCVDGRCMEFGCDGNSTGEGGGQVKDACGVCGGTGDTCQHGEFQGPLGAGERHTLTILPVGAMDILIGHPGDLQRDVSIEMWTKDVANQQPIVSKKRKTGYSTIGLQMPLNFAGTFWFYDKDLQTLSASGPLDQPVNITIHKNKRAEFKRALFRFTPHDDQAPPICENGGSPLAGGCSCPKGFYGLRCEHTCGLVCHNGAILDTRRCTCKCLDDRQTGRQCACKSSFNGKNCHGCSLTGCRNGGVFDSTACKCACPVNCGGLDCSLTCEDSTIAARCARQSWRCGQSESFANNCRKTCGFCKYDPNYRGGQCRGN